MSVFVNKEKEVGFPAPSDKHRALQMGLVHNLNKKLNGQYLVGMEYTVRKGRKERAPDVSVWEGMIIENDGEYKFQNPLLTIEITHTKDNDNKARTRIRDVFEMSDSVEESFISTTKPKFGRVSNAPKMAI